MRYLIAKSSFLTPMKWCFGLIISIGLWNGSASFAQNNSERVQEAQLPKTDFYDYRGTHGLATALGSAVINGDYANPEFGIYMGFGYKKSIIPHVNVNLKFNKFNLVYKDLFNKGFMSFDLNAEVLVFPHERFSPFVFFGGGANASNYFEAVDPKMQGGLGLEYIIYEGLSFRIFGDYNHVFSDALDGKIYGDADDVYWRMGCGLNFYFGGAKKKAKLLNAVPTIIKTNPIPADN
ncbi:Curli production assembly/transport component CsgG [Bizionia sp.]|uniref:Curli production assembly/transport component CsgG n=1 Tax=Bizionia sp. TaxID=1954480 RepID=UPI003A8F5247